MNALHHISPLRLWLTTVMIACTAATAPALAATRYAAPTPAGTQSCASPADACSITDAINNAAAGDQVILEPGDYGSPASPLSAELLSYQANVDIHGTDKTPGSPSAVIYSNSAYGMEIDGSGSHVSDLQIDDSGSSDGSSLAFYGAIAEHLIVQAGPNEAYACIPELNSTLRDSVCEQAGDGDGIDVNGVLDGPNTASTVAPLLTSRLAKLAPGTTYYYRLRASNYAGTTTATPVKFKTHPKRRR